MTKLHFSVLQVKYKEVKARNSQLLKMLQQGESELNIVSYMQLLFLFLLLVFFPFPNKVLCV